MIRRRRLRSHALRLASPTVGPQCEEGIFRKSTDGTRPSAVLRCARQLPRTSRLSAGENEGFRRLRSAGGILPLLAIAAERPRTAIRPKRQGWVFSARVKATAAAGGESAPFLCGFSLDTAPKTLHIVVGARTEHKFGKIVLDREHFFVYYKS